MINTHLPELCGFIKIRPTDSGSPVYPPVRRQQKIPHSRIGHIDLAGRTGEPMEKPEIVFIVENICRKKDFDACARRFFKIIRNLNTNSIYVRIDPNGLASQRVDVYANHPACTCHSGRNGDHT